MTAEIVLVAIQVLLAVVTVAMIIPLVTLRCYVRFRREVHVCYAAILRMIQSVRFSARTIMALAQWMWLVAVSIAVAWMQKYVMNRHNDGAHFHNTRQWKPNASPKPSRSRPKIRQLVRNRRWSAFSYRAKRLPSRNTT